MRKTYGRVLHWLIAPALEYARRSSEPRQSSDDTYVAAMKHALRDRNRVSMVEILADVLSLPVERWTMDELCRASNAMKILGWERRRASGSSREWYYLRAAGLDQRGTSRMNRDDKYAD